MAVTVYPRVPPRGIDVESGVRVRSTISLNVAVTDFAASIVTVQAPVPEHAPVQPVKIEPADAEAVRVTEVL